MDREILVNTVGKAAKEVFSTMLALEVQIGDSFIERSAPIASQKVVALIGLAGQWIGTGVISCSPEMACRISSLMLMASYEAVNEDVLDAMAEMANMIFGNVKTELEEQLGNLGLSIPTVIFGRNFATRSVGQQSWTVIPITAGEDRMELKICLAPNRDGHTNVRAQMRSHPALMEVQISS
jgi:chemotaxis protein CheX